MSCKLTIIQGKRGYGVSRILMLLYMVVVSIAAKAQSDSVALQRLTPEAEAYYKSLIPEKDTVNDDAIKKARADKFYKRLSIHTNLVDWATLVPNIGLEIDLKGTSRSNWTIGLYGKYNGRSKHTGFMYNVQSIRVEGRKYWRTGKQGKVLYHGEYEPLYVNKRDEKFNGDSLRGRFYNFYHKVRRNIISGRTIENARDWRAYYVGAYAGVDRWSISFGKNGKQGKGVYAGVVFGWTMPLLPQRFPKEGSLDLDLNLHLGVKAVSYSAFQYEDDTQHYVHDAASSVPGWKIVPYPVVQEINVGLVWRFRGIKNKVDRSLIDDYKNVIDAFGNRRTAKEDSLSAKINRIKVKQEQDSIRGKIFEDSTSYANYFHERRLRNALLLNPDTVFTGEDYTLKLKLIDGVDTSEKNLKLLNKQKKAAEAAAKKQADKEAAERRKQQKKEEKNKKTEKTPEEKKPEEMTPEAEKGGEE